MSDTDSNLTPQEELASLKDRAALLGISHHPAIGVDKLREKINEALAATDSEPDVTVEAPVVASTEETPVAKRQRLKREASKLIRVRVTCMNPAKKEWEGEIFTAGNAGIGSFKKYVPFNADDGWHVPNIILQVMRDRMCQVFTTVVDDRGNKVRRGKQIREFAIEVMDQLTPTELQELAARQAATKSIG